MLPNANPVILPIDPNDKVAAEEGVQTEKRTL